MICPDVNLLLYATFKVFPEHGRAKAWWDGVLSSAVPVRLGHVVILGFLRLASNPKVFAPPLDLRTAVAVVDSWLERPNVELLPPAPGHWENLKRMLLASQNGAQLATDAHIAALAADYGLVVHSNDADFARFPGIRCVNPLR